MPPKPAPEPFNVVERLLAAYATNNRINEYLIKNVPGPAWEAPPPGKKGRTISGIIGHIHNVRLMWLKAIGVEPLPAKLEGDEFSKEEAVAALNQSCAAVALVLEKALSTDGRVKGFKPDAASFIGYLIAHDAHHRGQISMLARQLGHPVPQSAMFGIWEWGVR